MLREFLLTFCCPDCGFRWKTIARVCRDDECERCGKVSMYVSSKIYN